MKEEILKELDRGNNYIFLTEWESKKAILVQYLSIILMEEMEKETGTGIVVKGYDELIEVRETIPQILQKINDCAYDWR